MFEVGFSEIVLILGLALLVLGPEKLPGLAEKVGRWTGRARAMARQLRTQLEQEVTIEELSKSRPAPQTPRSESESELHATASHNTEPAQEASAPTHHQFDLDAFATVEAPVDAAASTTGQPPVDKIAQKAQ